MLLQERNYELYGDVEIEDEDKSHQSIEQRASTASVGLWDDSPYAKNSSSSSFNNRLRRSTFDLSSISSLASSASDSSSYCCSSASWKSSTLRYRGQSPSSSKFVNPPSQEGAATQALLQQAVQEDTKSPFQEVHEEPTEPSEERQGSDDFCSQKSAAAPCAKDSIAPTTATCNIASSGPNCTSSVTQYLLEIILVGYLIVPFLELTIRIERYLRSTFGDFRRTMGLAFAALFASSSSFQEEPSSVNGDELYSSPITPALLEDRFDETNDYHGLSEAGCCNSSSSSSDDSNNESQKDSWGHFADFQDEPSFIPSVTSPLRSRAVAAVAAPPSCATTLETLAEGREEDDEAGDDWDF